MTHMRTFIMTQYVTCWVVLIVIEQETILLNEEAINLKKALEATLCIGLMGVVLNCTNFWKNPPAPLCPLFIIKDEDLCLFLSW